MSPEIIYVGLKAHVVAYNKSDGVELWRRKLRSAAASGDRFVTLLVEEERVFAHTYGELFCLDAKTGALLWSNPLQGLGYDTASLAVEGMSNSSLAILLDKRKKIAASAAAASSAGAGH